MQIVANSVFQISPGYSIAVAAGVITPIVAGDNRSSIEVDNVGSHLAVVAGHHLRVDVVGHYLVLDSSMPAFKNCPGSLEGFALLAGQHQH